MQITIQPRLIELTRSMAPELAPTIRVNAVCPGFIVTPMQEAEYTIEMRRALENKLPLNKLGRPDDVAAWFAFLASGDAAFIAGQYDVIDGGEIAGGLAGRTWRFDPLSERRTVSAEFLLPPEGHTVLAFGASVGTM